MEFKQNCFNVKNANQNELKNFEKLRDALYRFGLRHLCVCVCVRVMYMYTYVYVFVFVEWAWCASVVCVCLSVV